MRLVVEQRPTVAVLDIQMPGMSGIEATRQIKNCILENPGADLHRL